MKPQVYQTNTLTNTQSTEFSIKLNKEQTAHFTRLLVTSQYSDPLKAALREIISNAFDANTEAGTQKFGIKVTKTKTTITIRDYGLGLDPERIQDFYTVIGASSKQSDARQIGAYGIGRLAPLAAASSFHVTSYQIDPESLGSQVIAHMYSVFLNEDGIPAITYWGSKVSSETHTGLEVSISYAEKYTEQKATNYLINLLVCSRFPVKYFEVSAKDTKLGETPEVEESNLLDFSHLKLDSFPIHWEGNLYYVDIYEAPNNFLIRGYNTTKGGLVFYDLGGAIYSVDTFQPLLDSEEETTNPFIFESSFSPQISKTPILTNWVNHKFAESDISPLRVLIYIRLNPDSFELSSSREQLSLSTSNTKRGLKLNNLVVDIAHKRIRRLINQTITKEIPNWLKVVGSKEKVLQFIYHRLRCLLRYTGFSSSTFTFNLGYSKPIQIKGVENEELYFNFSPYLEEVKTKYYQFTSFNPLRGYVAKTPFFTCELQKIYIWEPSLNKEGIISKLDNLQLNYFSSFVYTYCQKKGSRLYPITRKSSQSFPFLELLVLRLPIVVVSTIGSLGGAGIKSIPLFLKITGHDPLTCPVVVIQTDNQGHLNYLDHLFKEYQGFIQYLGIYETVDKNKIKLLAPISSEREPHAKSVYSSGVIRLTSLIRKAGKSCYDTSELDTDPLTTITPESLQKVITYNKKDISNSIRLCVISECPQAYLGNIEPFGIYLTEYACEEIKKFKAEGKCNWIDREEALNQINNNLVQELGFSLYIAQREDLTNCLRTLVEAGFSKYLPSASLAALNYDSYFYRYLQITLSITPYSVYYPICPELSKLESSYEQRKYIHKHYVYGEEVYPHAPFIEKFCRYFPQPQVYYLQGLLKNIEAGTPLPLELLEER